MDRIRTAVIGTGFMGRAIWKPCAGSRMWTWWKSPPPRSDKARAAGAGYNVLNATGDWRDVIARSLRSTRCISPRPMSRIFPSPRRRFEAGKHVLCEKPLAMSVAEAARVGGICRRQKKLRGGLNHNLRYYPMVQQMRRMREAGDFGDILVVQGTYSQDWMLYETDWNWRVDPEVSGVSRVMADIGSHFFDMAEHVTGLKVIAGMQRLGRPSGPPASSRKVAARLSPASWVQPAQP